MTKMKMLPAIASIAAVLMFFAGLDDIYGDDRRSLDEIEEEEADA